MARAAGPVVFVDSTSLASAVGRVTAGGAYRGVGVYGEDSQLRTLQRHVHSWRAMKGPAKEVYFGQVHEPAGSVLPISRT